MESVSSALVVIEKQVYIGASGPYTGMQAEVPAHRCCECVLNGHAGRQCGGPCMKCTCQFPFVF